MTIWELVGALQGDEPGQQIALVVVAAIAVLASDATTDAIAAVTGLATPEVAQALDMLRRNGVVTGSPVLRFVDDNAASDVLERAPARQIDDLHARAAERLHEEHALASDIAAHLVHAPPLKASWVIDVLRQTARERRRAGDQPGAAIVLERALAERPAVEIYTDVLLELASVEARIDTDDAIRRYEEALPLIDDPQRRTQVRQRLAVCLGYANRVHDALAVADEAATEATTDEDRIRAGLTFVEIARQSLDTRPLGPERLRRLTEDVADHRGSLELAVLAELAYEQCLVGEPKEEVVKNALAALGGEGMTNVHELAPLGRHVAILSLTWSGELRHAENAVELMLNRSLRRGDAVSEGGARQLRMMIDWHRSRFRDVIDDADRALARGGGSLMPTLPSNRGYKALALASLGEFDAARKAMQLPGGDDAWSSVASYHGYLVAASYASLLAGDHEHAHRLALRCGALAKRMGTLNPAVLFWQAVAAEAAGALGMHESARPIAEDAVIAARRFGAPWAISIALFASAAVETDTACVIQLLEEATRIAESTPHRHHLARCRHRLGVALQRVARDEEAAAQLSRARQAAVELGAVALVRDIDAAATPAGSVESSPRPAIVTEPLTRAVTPATTGAVTDALPAVHAQVLGGFRVVDARGEDITPSGVPGKAFRILIAAGRPLHGEELADRIWGEAGDASRQRARLRNVLSRLRTPDGSLVERREELIELAPMVVTDVQRFEQAAAAALAANADGGALDATLTALTLYAGDPFPTDPFADWALLPREQLRRRYLTMIDLGCELAMSSGLPDLAIEILEGGIRHDPYDESRYARAAAIEESSGHAAAARTWRKRAEHVAESLAT